jgi:hypothetical protein
MSQFEDLYRMHNFDAWTHPQQPGLIQLLFCFVWVVFGEVRYSQRF